MKEKSSVVDPEVLRQQRLDQELRIDFGYTFTTEYHKHGNHGVNQVLYNPNMKAFVSCNEKQIHVWGQHDGAQLFQVNFFEETKSHAISCFCYSRKHMVFFVISTDFKLHVFNENMIHVCEVHMKTSLISYCFFYEPHNLLVCGGVDGCYIFQLQIHCKYTPQMALTLDPYGSNTSVSIKQTIKLEDAAKELSIGKFDGMKDWTKGLHLCSETKLLISWSNKSMLFWDLKPEIL